MAASHSVQHWNRVSTVRSLLTITLVLCNHLIQSCSLFVFLPVLHIHSSSMMDEAKRWFEASTVICNFVPGGKERAEKVRQIRMCVSSMALHWCVHWGSLTDETWINLSRFQKLIPIFFHDMGQNAKPRKDMGPFTRQNLCDEVGLFNCLSVHLGASCVSVSVASSEIMTEPWTLSGYSWPPTWYLLVFAPLP